MNHNHSKMLQDLLILYLLIMAFRGDEVTWLQKGIIRTMSLTRPHLPQQCSWIAPRGWSMDWLNCCAPVLYVGGIESVYFFHLLGKQTSYKTRWCLLTCLTRNFQKKNSQMLGGLVHGPLEPNCIGVHTRAVAFFDQIWPKRFWNMILRYFDQWSLPKLIVFFWLAFKWLHNWWPENARNWHSFRGYITP